MGTITSEQIESGIPESARGFFKIESGLSGDGAWIVIQSFWKAVELILPKIHIKSPVQVIFATAPFRVHMNRGTLSFEPDEVVIGAHIYGFVFLDVVKLFNMDPRFQIAVILEELTHALMNIRDEVLVKKVVALLYPEVEFDPATFRE